MYTDNATCAACDAPIDRGDKFVISGTEVFHRRKACVNRIANSRLTRARMEIEKHRNARVKAEDEVRRAVEIAENMVDVGRRSVESVETMEEVVKSERAARRAADESATLRKETLDTMREQHARVSHELAVARAQVRELQAAAETASRPSQTADTTTDDMALRFSLMEFE